MAIFHSDKRKSLSTIPHIRWSSEITKSLSGDEIEIHRQGIPFPVTLKCIQMGKSEDNYPADLRPGIIWIERQNPLPDAQPPSLIRFSSSSPLCATIQLQSCHK